MAGQISRAWKARVGTNRADTEGGGSKVITQEKVAGLVFRSNKYGVPAHCRKHPDVASGMSLAF